MDLAGFALAVLLIELTPGPNMAWLAGLAATEGRKDGLAAVMGIAVGLMGNGLLAALGLAALLQAAPGLWIALRLGGAVMIVWLAFATWRDASQPASNATQTSVSVRSFGAGLMINLFNPKAYIFFLVIAPQFMKGSAFGLRGAFVFSAVSVAIATLIHTAIVLAGDSAHAWVENPARTKWVKRAFAIAMLGVAVSFAVVDLRLS